MKTIEELEAELENLTEIIEEIDAKLLFIASYIVGEELEYETMTEEEIIKCVFAVGDDRPEKLDS